VRIQNTNRDKDDSLSTYKRKRSTNLENHLFELRSDSNLRCKCSEFRRTFALLTCGCSFEPPGSVVQAVTNIIVRVSRIILLNTGAAVGSGKVMPLAAWLDACIPASQLGKY
jgi:hypothetical protein